MEDLITFATAAFFSVLVGATAKVFKRRSLILWAMMTFAVIAAVDYALFNNFALQRPAFLKQPFGPQLVVLASSVIGGCLMGLIACGFRKLPPEPD